MDAPQGVRDLGLFKTPFSAEFLIPFGNIDFTNRSRVVRTLFPGRQVGAQVRGEIGPAFYAVGLFNGNGLGVFVNDDNRFMPVGRLGVQRLCLEAVANGLDGRAVFVVRISSES